ncbi:MAG: hypothetical protein C0608_02795 [Deltaproteobacteria bacterium]|nr:MAG: hypothetical protein C0608_02795 [Deltaproteobacteria bacterium]
MKTNNCDINTKNHPTSGTNAAEDYFRAAISELDFFTFITNLVIRSDYVSYIAKNALDNTDIPDGFSPIELAKKSPGVLTKNLEIIGNLY